MTKTVNSILQLLSLVILLAFVSNCKNPQPKPRLYAIHDFSDSLQPCLWQAVANCLVGETSQEKYIKEHATKEELEKLSKSEHPILRAIAFRIMLERPEFDHFAIVMNNLSDTAMFAKDEGEFGLEFYRVADEIVQKAKWEDTASKMKTIDKMLLQHNDLRTSYQAICTIGADEKYYASIKQMATRFRPHFLRLQDEINDERLSQDFETREYALYGLARYKKPEDIALIKSVMLSERPNLTTTSFRLMEDFPDTAYMEVFEKYYHSPFYARICSDRRTDYSTDFIYALGAQKNERSAKLLEEILNMKPIPNCLDDLKDEKERAAYAVWNNDCPAYANLRKQVTPAITEYEKGILRIDANSFIERPKDTAKEPVRWQYWQLPDIQRF